MANPRAAHLPSIQVRASISTGGCALSVVFRILAVLLYVGLARRLSAAECCAYSQVQTISTIYFDGDFRFDVQIQSLNQSGLFLRFAIKRAAKSSCANAFRIQHCLLSSDHLARDH